MNASFETPYNPVEQLRSGDERDPPPQNLGRAGADGEVRESGDGDGDEDTDVRDTVPVQAAADLGRLAGERERVERARGAEDVAVARGEDAREDKRWSQDEGFSFGAETGTRQYSIDCSPLTMSASTVMPRRVMLTV